MVPVPVHGDLPPRTGTSLVTSNGGSIAAIFAGLVTDGCYARAIFANQPDGGLVGYYAGAPESLNAQFTSIWPDGLPGGEPMMAICLPPKEIPVATWAAHVCTAAQTFDDAYAASWDNATFPDVRGLTVAQRVERATMLVPQWIEGARTAEAALMAIEPPQGTADYHAALVASMSGLADAWEASLEQYGQATTAEQLEALNALAGAAREAGEAAAYEAGRALAHSTRTTLRGINPCGTIAQTHSLTGNLVRLPGPDVPAEE